MSNKLTLGARLEARERRVRWLMLQPELDIWAEAELGRFTTNPIKRGIFKRLQAIGLYAPTSDCGITDLRVLVDEARRRIA